VSNQKDLSFESSKQIKKIISKTFPEYKSARGGLLQKKERK